ncbi:oligosaccharide flippase family protein [Hyphococcus sp.]|uniref:oligosaccharide flippase family protein n=1 Tax=Hyphococcus sp. TaxID=2038636 RepID=UPI002087F3E4|nr:MAG: hypothetical protein DHS20C04_27800 [Marinicaulis sp.]
MNRLTTFITKLGLTAGLRSDSSLRARVQTGSLFTLGGFGVGQVLRLVSNLILTRLVMPEAFGLMAVAVSINIWAIMLTDIGINAGVIRSKNSDDPEFLRTAWTLQIVRNFLVWTVILFAAFAVFVMSNAGVFRAESIYTNPLLPWIMAATGAQLGIAAFASANQTMAQRKLQIGKVVALEISVQLFAMVVTVGFAAMGAGVWALVTGMLASAAFNAIASHFVFTGPRMKFAMNREYFSEIFHFGKWLIIASFFGFFVNRGDQIVFGGFMTSDRFSLYVIATIWITAASTVMQTLTNRIFYPAFSEILRERPESLTAAYRKARIIIDLASIALAYGAFLLSGPVFRFIYPEAYEGVGYFMQLLSPFLLLTPFRLINTTILADGDSKQFTAITVLAGVAMLIMTPLAFHFLGEKAAVVVFSVIEGVSLPIIWRLGAKRLSLDPWVEGRALLALILLILLIFTVG